MKSAVTFLSLFLIAVTCMQCKPKETATPEANRLSAEEISEGWELLFDGVSFNGWRNFNSDTLVGWVIDSGNLLALGQGGDHANDIITIREFENFELSLEWKTSVGGNSGIFFNAVEDSAIKAIYEIAPEYQIIDEVTWDGDSLTEGQKAAGCYDMYYAATAKKLMPVGQYNVSKISVNKGRVQHWLNGDKVAEYQMWTAEWDSLKSVRKWKDYPLYGTARKGHIGLQDHGRKTWFRNIKIRSL
ncbi:MAG: DUF1080 domain-containing protein [Bacteroidales bacterium]|nr:DUF1080 domain-containing protein [Bacteroidales bacterium]